MASSPTLPAGQQSPQQQQQDHPLAAAPFTHTIELFSDGSVRSQRWAGCGVSYAALTPGQWQGRAIALPDNKHIQSAEFWGFYAALDVAQELLARCKDPDAVRFITVKTDSDAVEKAYGVEQMFTSRQGAVRSWGDVTNRIDAKIASFQAKGVVVTAQWVKGHANNDGNEKADQMARYGSYLAKSAGPADVIYCSNPTGPELRAANL